MWGGETGIGGLGPPTRRAATALWVAAAALPGGRGGGVGEGWGEGGGRGAEGTGDLQVQGQWHGGRAQHQLEMSHHLMSAGRLSITWSAPGRTSSN